MADRPLSATVTYDRGEERRAESEMRMGRSAAAEIKARKRGASGEAAAAHKEMQGAAEDAMKRRRADVGVRRREALRRSKR